VVNVSETELAKSGAEEENRILAVLHADRGQLRGSRKNPSIGRAAFQSVRAQLLTLMRGNLVFSSTGGGTGTGITASLLDDLTARDRVPENEKTTFALLLPYAEREPAEFVVNTIEFLLVSLSHAIDSGNTGNIFLFSNGLKFRSRLQEAEYNRMLIDSLNVFLAVPAKGEQLTLLDGHIDYEDFALYQAKPYFNHFTYFDYDASQDFGPQLEANLNPLLLPPESPIEALFLLEVPTAREATAFYDILEHFAVGNVTPVFSVVENPEREQPFVTVSLLYSRKPAELVDDFSRISHEHARAKVEKSLQQYVTLPRLEVDLEEEAEQAARQAGSEDKDILTTLRRLGKL
jgi:hypothetical protein